MSLAIIQWAEIDAQQRVDLLQRPAGSQSDAVRATAARIVTAVRKGGDAALIKYTQLLDGATISQFRVTAAEISGAVEQLTVAQLDAIDLAITNVRKFHEQQRPVAIAVETMPGVLCERVSHPLDAVGLYVPAGTAPLPSAAIMLAVPASIAACPRIILCTPPRGDGTADPAVLAAASRAGVTEIYKVGGAQAIAAMAYGTESVPQVCKIFGPGNAWVTSAKSIVSADAAGAAIDMPAGPSEVLIIGDADASAEFIAADLLAQAEHGTDSQALLLTDDAALVAAVNFEIDSQLKRLTRASIVSAALANSRAIIVDDIATAIAISNRYAPEHLILQIENPRDALPALRNAGSVFVGRWTPESVGDYCSGTNHVLPTYGYADTYSGLGVDQFLRYMTIQHLSREGLHGIGDAVITLANLEGLDAHAAAVSCRLGVPA